MESINILIFIVMIISIYVFITKCPGLMLDQIWPDLLWYSRLKLVLYKDS